MSLRVFVAFLSLTFFTSNLIQAQFGFSHEIGVIAGPTFFQTDYGQAGDFGNFIKNKGFGIGIVHYLNFSYRSDCNCYAPYTYFNDHFKLRSEISYYRSGELRHYGKWVDPDRTSITADQLRAMRGRTSVTSLGMQLEYFPWSIRDFSATVGSFAPFVSLGAHYDSYKPEAWSTMGVLGISETTPVKYRDAFDLEGGSTWSVVGSIGTRYKLTVLSDLMLDFRWKYFNSNWVDGLNPDPVRYPENKANEWLFFVNFGYIYYLD